MPHANRFRDPVVRPKVALIGIAITLSVWLIVFGCANVVRSCGSKESSPFHFIPPGSAADRGTLTPSVPPVFPVPEDARGFVRVPAGTKEVKLTLRKNEWSQWILLPFHHHCIMKHNLFPIKIQTWGEQPVTIQNEETVLRDLTDGKLRILPIAQGGEFSIFLEPQR